MINHDIVAKAESYLWNNWKFYLQSYNTCLLDLLLSVENENATTPIERYRDFLNELEKHMGLGSYVNVQAAQFSNIPYLTVNLQAVPMGKCNTRVVMGFDIVFSTDTPPATDSSTFYVGSSSESVAKFRSDMINAINQIMYQAFGNNEANGWESQAFFDLLRDNEVQNPTNPADKTQWKYNIRGSVEDEITMTEVEQLKREDRTVGLSVFHVIYHIDIYNLWDGINYFGC